ncbi:MAG: type II toxin-antitoxin system prevent-host-death family antitoxin [Pirellulales bacterium]
MTSVGSYEAKTHLPQLLERVALGERITITKRGKPVAMLVPATGHEQKDIKQVVKEMLEYRDRQKRTLGGITFRQLINEGRRY